MNLNKQYIKDVLHFARSSETELAHAYGVSYATYWRRSKLGIWKFEQVSHLATVLSSIAGKTITVEEITE